MFFIVRYCDSPSVLRPAEWGADVDAYVVHTNYNEYAIVIMIKQKSSEVKSTSVKLYSKWTLSIEKTGTFNFFFPLLYFGLLKF